MTKIALDIRTGEFVIVDGEAREVTAITDVPASDVEGAARWIKYAGGMLAVYASEHIAIA